MALWGEGVYSTTFDPVLRNEVKKFSYVCLWGWGGGVYSTTCHLELRNEIFTLISFMHLKNFQTVTTCFTAKNAKMQKYTTVPTCFTTKNYPK